MIDGCTRWGAFMRVILPLSLPGLTSAFVLNAILGWSQFIVPFILHQQAGAPADRGRHLQFPGNVQPDLDADARCGERALDRPGGDRLSALAALDRRRADGRRGEGLTIDGACGRSDLVKKYGDLQVVHGIDFEINNGEFVVLVGPSGCGKSTILRMIAGLETVTGGEIVIDNEVVNDVPPRERDVAMVFQDYALYPHMSVRQNLGFGLRMRGRQAQRDRGGGEADGGDPSDREPARAQAEGALRRPAPACRHRSRDRARAAAVSVRRAALQPRREAPRRHAHADQAAAPEVQDDERLRDARSGGGDDARRPHRRSCGAASSSRSARPPTSTAHRATCSSRAS